MENNYLLMYRDIPIVKFNTDTKDSIILHPSFLPFGQRKIENGWNIIRSFCADRMLLTNRKYCKEILISCLINDQSDVNICLISRALSFRDNYWIKQENSKETWENINLYNNPFSAEISYTALTGETCSVSIGDEIYTGELTSHGTRAKCYIRQNGNIYLAKAETLDEIASEILSSHIADFLGINATKYSNTSLYGKNVSICKIETNELREMISCRDILKNFGCKMKIDTNYYDFFIENCKNDFIKMQVFDYLTLNTDRNRDNFALEKCKNKIVGLYPLFDHDSCFKGKNFNAYYFVTGLSFNDTFEFLLERYEDNIINMKDSIYNLYNNITKNEEFKYEFLSLKNEEIYNSFLARIDNSIVKIQNKQKENSILYNYIGENK